MAKLNEQNQLFDVKSETVPVKETSPEVSETVATEEVTVFKKSWIAKSRIKNGNKIINLGGTVTDKDISMKDAEILVREGVLEPKDV